MILMFYFGILRIFGEKSQKSKNWKSGHIGFLRQRREPTPPTPRLGMPSRGEAEVPKWHPSGTPRSSYCSQRAKFWILL